jgi:bis(5'-nucleosyl)-tetraphosphatase (symmetrical)
LARLDFSPSRDRLVLLGDLVNRGPASLAVLQRVAAMGDAAVCLLGNHDLHLLAVAYGARAPHPSDTVQDILAAPDRQALLDWVGSRPLAVQAHGWLMVHAGVLPSWTLGQTLSLAGEVQAVLRGPDLPYFLAHMYGNEPAAWRDDLTGLDRWRVVVNALTRLRFCAADGTMEFATKDSAAQAPAGFMPWFDVPGRRTAGITVAFGHWSTLGWQGRSDIWSLDTGCVWGGCLSAMRQGEDGQRALVQVACAQAQVPG